MIKSRLSDDELEFSQLHYLVVSSDYLLFFLLSTALAYKRYWEVAKLLQKLALFNSIF